MRQLECRPRGRAWLWALCLVLCMAVLPGCAAAQESSSLPPGLSGEGSESSAAPNGGTEADGLNLLRARVSEGGALCAVAYLGSAEDIAAFLASEEAGGYRTGYPFLWDIPEENWVAQPGMELYCIVPADPRAEVCVRGWDGVEGDYLGETGEVLYCGGAPVLLQGNASDIMPNLQVSVTSGVGEKVVFVPCLSLRDGGLNTVGAESGIYDFTVYPEGFVREE